MKVRPFRGRFEVDLHYRAADGRRVRVRRVAPVNSKSAATRWGQALAEQLFLQQGIEVMPPPPTLAAFAPRYLDSARADRRKPSTLANIEAHLRNHLLPLLGSKALDEIGAEEVQRLKARLAGRSPSTTNNVLSTLSRLLRTAVEWEVLPAMPCRITLLHRPHVEMKFFDFPEFERLVDAARKIDTRSVVVILLGGEAGLRAGEMMGLEWTDLDFKRRQLRVARSVWKGHVTEPKSGRPRFIPMTTRLAAALAAHRHLRAKRVLCRTNGKALIQQEVQRIVAAVERLANVDHLGVHALRHSFCSHLAMRGAPAKAIQELAGHSELVTTQRYMHLSPAAKESAIRLLEQPPPFADVDAGEGYRNV
jgi:integrase